MKANFFFVVLLLNAGLVFAQATSPSSSTPLHREGWTYGLWADYGNGIGSRTDVHSYGAGLRVGRVMTGEHGSGWGKGTFELDADLTPVEIYHFPATLQAGNNLPVAAQNFYTGGFTPLIMKWNFTHGREWVPFVAAEGGIVFSTKNMPPGDTSTVNFTSGAAFGFHRFVHERSAWTFQGKIYHLSNASLGPHNPGVNAALQFKIGYTWFK